MMITFPDKLFATIKTVFVLVFSALFVCFHTALLHGDVLIQQIAAIRTMAHGYVLTPVIKVGATAFLGYHPKRPPFQGAELLRSSMVLSRNSSSSNGARMNADHLL